MKKSIVFQNVLYESENEMDMDSLLRIASNIKTQQQEEQEENDEKEWREHCLQMKKEAEERRKENERIQKEEEEREKLYQMELQKQKEEQEKIEEQKRIEEEIEKHEEQQFLNKIEEKQIMKIERDLKKCKFMKTSAFNPTINFSTDIKAVYSLPNVSYFDRQNLRSKESMFMFIDSSNYDNLQTDAWSSIQYRSENWIEIGLHIQKNIEISNIQLFILKMNFHFMSNISIIKRISNIILIKKIIFYYQ